MTPTGSLNKDVAPVTDGCGSRLFNWSRFSPHPSTSCSSRLHKWSDGTSYSFPSPRGVCCSILMTKRGAGARSHYHTLICLKRASFTIQAAGVHRNPVKAGGCITDKKETAFFFFCPRSKGYPVWERCLFFNQCRGQLHVFQWDRSCTAPSSLLLLSLSLRQ